MNFKDLIDNARLPEHVAIIMDGNGRWAKQKGKLRVFGHKNAIKAVRDTVEGAAELGIGYLTLYAFSTENWNRPKKEVSALMSLLVTSLHKELKTLTNNNIRLSTIGNIKNLPESCQKELIDVVEKTKNNTHMNLILALSYSSHWEIVEAIKSIAHDVKSNKLDIESINESLVSASLATKDIPNPELMIRTSGEYRISNFLLWQLAYAELYFTEKLWPDFRRDDLFEAIANFQKRERRFGLTSEQLNSVH